MWLGDLAFVEWVPCKSRLQRNKDVILGLHVWNLTRVTGLGDKVDRIYSADPEGPVGDSSFSSDGHGFMVPSSRTPYLSPHVK